MAQSPPSEPSQATIDPNQIPLDRILVPMALAEPSITLAYARRLAAPGKAELRLLHVVEFSRAALSPAILAQIPTGDTDLDARQRRALARLDGYCEVISQAGISCGATVRVGVPHEQILEEAEQFKPDLIIVGNRATSALSRFTVGTTSERVVRHALCPVLVAHRSPQY